MGAPTGSTGQSDLEKFSKYPLSPVDDILNGITRTMDTAQGRGPNIRAAEAQQKFYQGEDIRKLYGKEGETLEQAQMRKQLADVANNPDTYAGFREQFSQAALNMKTTDVEFQKALAFSSKVGVYDPKTKQITGGSDEARIRMQNEELLRLMTEQPGKKSLLAGR